MPDPAAERMPLLVMVFLAGLLFPLMIDLGPLRLSVYRMVLLLSTIPCLLIWAGGSVGRWRLADFCIIMIGVWGTLSWGVLHGFGPSIEAIGIHVVETWGAYFLGRCMIRTPGHFRRLARLMLWMIAAMMPFLVVEMVTGKRLILMAIRAIGATYGDATAEPRLGMTRAQGPFQHPILLGVFCGSSLSLAYYVASEGRALIVRVFNAAVIVLATFCGLSSGPLGGLGLQLLMIGWDGVFRNFPGRWWGLAACFALGYVVVDLLSNRTPIMVMFSYLAFNTNTAYGRLTVLEWGWQDVLKHPLFGNVLGDWDRPAWLTTSVDMFWLERAMSHGIPMGVFYLLAPLSLFVVLARRKITSPKLKSYRMGYIGSMVGLFGSGWAVHFWNEPYVLLMFLMGSGVWLLDYDSGVEETNAAPAERTRPRAAVGNLRERRSAGRGSVGSV